MEAARRLREAKSKDKRELSEAVRLNWRLWTIFQSSMLEPDCPWPVDLRGNILSLADFIDKRSVALLSKPDPEGVEVLVNINLQIGGGLLAEAVGVHTGFPFGAYAYSGTLGPELLGVPVGVVARGVDARVEGVGQLVELAHHPLGVARVVTREGRCLG